jgi:transcriptional regulator with XRE-family HTH domain
MIGNEIRRLRRRRGWTLRELAERSGIAEPNISQIERGRVDPRLSSLQRLLGALDAELTTQDRKAPTPLAEVSARARRGRQTLRRTGIASPEPLRRLARKAEMGEDIGDELERLEAMGK